MAGIIAGNIIILYFFHMKEKCKTINNNLVGKGLFHNFLFPCSSPCGMVPSLHHTMYHFQLHMHFTCMRFATKVVTFN